MIITRREDYRRFDQEVWRYGKRVCSYKKECLTGSLYYLKKHSPIYALQRDHLTKLMLKQGDHDAVVNSYYSDMRRYERISDALANVTIKKLISGDLGKDKEDA